MNKNKVYLGDASWQIDKNIFDQCENSLENFLNRRDIGFPFLPHRSELLDEVLRVGDWAKKQWDQFVVVGIGGSSLGALAIADAFCKDNVHFLDNVDMLQLQRLILKVQNPRRWGWIFISKSGTTIETLACLEWLDSYYAAQNMKLSAQSLVITEPRENTLGKWADHWSIPRLTVPLDVGGRFSVLSPVGLLPAYLMGLDPSKFLQGAAEALRAKELVTSIMAQMVASFQREEWITLFWQYSSEMKSFGAWIQQLWCESLGKKVNVLGQSAPRVSTGVWAVGASDQHSILQQVMEGARDKFVVFMRYHDVEGNASPLANNLNGAFKSSQFSETTCLIGKNLGHLLAAEAEATCAGLREEGVSTLNMHTGKMSEETLGFLFMTFQLVVAGLGQYLNINAFDQPGVELGKKLAKGILQKEQR